MHSAVRSIATLIAFSMALGTCSIVAVAMADEAKSPGIVTSISRSANLSTGGMPPGSEMWAIWVSLPAGKKVEVKEPKVPSTWMDLEVVLTGSSVSASLSGKVSDCVLIDAEGQKDLTGQETTTRPGDAVACNFTTGNPYWEENRGGEVYSRVQLNIGGPWVPGTYDISLYRDAGGDFRALRSIRFYSVERKRNCGLQG